MYTEDVQSETLSQMHSNVDDYTFSKCITIKWK